MRYASIDIGTNTLRLLIAEAGPGGGMTPIIYRRAITRLGGGFDPGTGIAPDAAERTIAALEEFGRVITANPVDSVTAVATSAVRRAANRDRFLAEIKRRAGIAPEVISGDREASLGLVGVLSVLKDRGGRKLVMDIGGGSTEFIAAVDAARRGAWSMEMGVVHLSERHLKSDPPTGTELGAMEAEISGVMDKLTGLMRRAGLDPDEYSSSDGAVFVGTAGTITTLAALDQDLDVYDRERINNYVLAKDRVRAMYRRLNAMTLDERSRVLSLEKGREDLIIPGTAVVLKAMDEFGFESLTVSDAGLLEGVIIDAAARAGTK